MAKLTLTDLANLQNEQTAVTAINNNSAATEVAMEKTLSRDGTAPNEMEDVLDMNDNQILNLPAPATADSPLRLQDLNTFIGGGTVTNIPAGGTTGQKLGKVSNTDYDVAWQTVDLTNQPLSNLATQAAYTFVGNNTGSAASPTAVDIAAVTTKATPAGSDYILLSDQAASGAWKKATFTSFASSGGSIAKPGGRLTLQTAVPVMTTTQSAKTAIFYTPYQGNQIPIYDGTTMTSTTFTELTVATTDTAKNPAAIGASKVNDWFVWNDAGTLRISHGPDWTSDTARSAGTALVMVNGILLNNVSITNGPAASRGTYVGTTRSNASSQLDFILPTADGTAALINIWNAYNRVNVSPRIGNAAASYTYTTATIRQLGGAATNQINFVTGLAEDTIDASLHVVTSLSAAVGAFKEYYIQMDSTTTGTDVGGACQNGVAVAAQFTVALNHSYSPQLGHHFISENELGDGTNNNTVIGQKYNRLVVRLRY